METAVSRLPPLAAIGASGPSGWSFVVLLSLVPRVSSGLPLNAPVPKELLCALFVRIAMGTSTRNAQDEVLNPVAQKYERGVYDRVFLDTHEVSTLCSFRRSKHG